MGNTNNISAFEKIVFVDKINNEYDAEQLSKEYPFAFILTEKTQNGLEQGILYDEENNELLFSKEFGDVTKNNESSGNIWKGGKRITKFVNVNYNANVAHFDAYDLRIDFDQISGLLSFKKVAKIDNYKLVSLFYKEKNTDSLNNNDYKIKAYVNKKKILEDFNNNYLSTYYFNVSDIDDFLKNFDDINILKNIDEKDNIYEMIEDPYIEGEEQEAIEKDKGFINSIDNKFYIVLRFEAESESTLNTVNVDTFNIISNNTNIELKQNATVLNNQTDLKNFTHILDNDILEILSKVTYNYRYLNNLYGSNDIKHGRYIIYECEIQNFSNDLNSYNFMLKNADNLSDFNINLGKLYINPTAYKLIINENEVDFDNLDISTYMLPGSSVNCRFEVYPNKISDVTLHLDLPNSTHFKFKTLNETDNNDYLDITNATDSISENNKFSFTIEATDNFRFYDGEQPSYLQNITSLLNISLKNSDGNIFWQNNTKIRKYVWVGWKFDHIEDNNPYGYEINIESYLEGVTSGTKTGFNTGSIYCEFNTDINSPTDTIKYLDITNDVEASFVFEPGLPENNLDNNNGGLPVSVPCNKNISITVPFIFKKHDEAKFYITYKYKNISVEGDHVKIIPDMLASINISTGVTFNEYNNNEDDLNIIENTESSVPVEIKKHNSENRYIEFEYTNNFSINACKYIYKTLEEFKDSILIGLTGTNLEDNGKNNQFGIPYIKIENGKIIYSPNDATNNSNVIDLRLTYYDDNYNMTIKSNIINLVVKKLIIDYWIYLGEIHTLHYQNNDPSGFVTSVEYVIPDIPENIQNAYPHFIQYSSDNPNDRLYNSKLYCGKLYRYENLSNPAANNYRYIETPSNDDNEYAHSFGTWIHLGSEEDMKELKLSGSKENTLFEGIYDMSEDKQYGMFGGNKEWMIIMLPDILDIKSLGASLSWPISQNRENLVRYFKKGIYNAYIINDQTVLSRKKNAGTANEETLYYGDGFVNPIQYKT